MTTTSVKSISSKGWIKGKVLGRGAYGIVYEVRRPFNNNCSYFLPSLMALKSSSNENSLIEEQMLMMFKPHPNIIRCYGSEITHFRTKQGINIPLYNIFLEYATGGSLADEIHKIKGVVFSEKKVSKYLKGMLLGLKEIHKAGIIHCDIKPDNILIARGVPKIADFGLAIKATEIITGMRGTPPFMAPEIIANEIYTSTVDIWSLGCTVLVMLTGKNVWGVPFDQELMRFIGAYDVIPRIPNELSAECRDFLQRCLMRDFKRRWSAESLLNHPFLFKKHEDTDIKFKKSTYLEVLMRELT